MTTVEIGITDTIARLEQALAQGYLARIEAERQDAHNAVARLVELTEGIEALVSQARAIRTEIWRANQ